MSTGSQLGAGPVGYHRLHPDRGIEFQANRFLQWIGPCALAEVRAAIDTVDSYPAWTEAFLGLAADARGRGRDLAAAYYDRAAEFFMPVDDPRRRPARDRFVRAMQQIYGLRPELVRYEDGHLPAYDLAPAAPSRPGTIVLFGGFDEYVEENFPLLATVAAAGHRVIAFDGPGQGGALEDYGLAMTADWERPVGAVLDHFGLDEVTLIGVSLGGGLAVRAAAFEPRVERVVALDALDDFLECLARQALPGAAPLLRLLLALRARPVLDVAARVAAARTPLAAWGLRQGMHVTGTVDPYDFFRAARALSTRGVSRHVTADVLLLAGADDHYVPTHQLHRQARALRRARSVTTRLFTATDQAANHCQVGNLGVALRTTREWMSSLDAADR